MIACVVLAASAAAVALPPPDEIDACALLTEEEVGAYRGDAVTSELSTAVRQAEGQRISSCHFRAARGPGTSVSVSLRLGRDIETIDAGPGDRVEPLAGIGDEAWQHVSVDDRGIIPDSVSLVVAGVGQTHLVTIAGGLAQRYPDPELVRLLELAVSRLRALEGSPGGGEEPSAEGEESTTGGLGGIERPQVDEHGGAGAGSSRGGGVPWLLILGIGVPIVLAGVIAARRLRRPTAGAWGEVDAGLLPWPGLVEAHEQALAEALRSAAALPAVTASGRSEIEAALDEVESGALGQPVRALGQQARAGGGGDGAQWYRATPKEEWYDKEIWPLPGWWQKMFDAWHSGWAEGAARAELEGAARARRTSGGSSGTPSSDSAASAFAAPAPDPAAPEFRYDPATGVVDIGFGWEPISSPGWATSSRDTGEYPSSR